MADRPRMLVAGGYGTGLTFVTGRVPERSETVLAHSFAIGPGGKGSNQAIGAARLGAAVTLFSAIGDDLFGRQAVALWNAEGVDHAYVVVVPGAPTMAGAILVEPGGDNRILVAPGVLAMLDASHADACDRAVAEAAVVLVSLEIATTAAWRICELATRHRVPVVLNPAPVTSIPVEVLASVGYLTPNRFEAAALAGLPESTIPVDLHAAVCRMTPATVAMTLGGDGVMVGSHRGDRVHVPVPVAEVVDTTGAGDAFNAAFAVALASGADAVTAARYGARAGAHAVTIHEVIPSLPTVALLGRPEVLP